MSSMGIISFEYMRNDPGWSGDEISTPDLPAHLKRKYGLSIEAGRHLLELLFWMHVTRVPSMGENR